MDGYSISQVSDRTGFPASTLRFYERSGLVRPARTPAGYRRYDDHHLEVLAFIGRAKGFGLSLDEITELLLLLDEERCAPVQDRLRALVGAKIADARARITELVAFTAELQRVSATLRRHTPDGPCDDACGCTSDEGHLPSAVVLTTKQDATSPPIACTLAPEQVGDRIDDWRAALALATSREPTEGGMRVRFPRGVGVEALAALAAAEQDCCPFFTLALTFDVDGVAFEVTGPPDARPVIDALVGTAS